MSTFRGFSTASLCVNKNMPKIVYANLTWFIIIVAAAIGGSINRHASSTWDAMPDVRLNYDLMFVGAFALLLILSLIGIYKKKNWGYVWAMTFNYILISFSITPSIAVLIFSFNKDEKIRRRKVRST